MLKRDGAGKRSDGSGPSSVPGLSMSGVGPINVLRYLMSLPDNGPDSRSTVCATENRKCGKMPSVLQNNVKPPKYR